MLAAGTGALAAPGDVARGTQSASDFLKSKTAGMDTGLVKSGLEGLGSMSEGLQKTGDILRPGGLKPEGIKDLGKAAMTLHSHKDQ